MASENKQLNVRMDESDFDDLDELVELMRTSTSIDVTKADAVKAAIRVLKRHYKEMLKRGVFSGPSSSETG